MKPSLGQAVHDLRPGKGLGEKDDIGIVRSLTSAISQSQKRNGLVWGLSTRKMRTPCSTQKIDNDLAALARAPASPSALEIEGVDVLVFLGRVFRVLDAAVGTVAKPFRMLA